MCCKKKPLIVTWLGINWYGTPYPKRMPKAIKEALKRYREVIKEDTSGCGCIVRFKKFMRWFQRKKPNVQALHSKPKVVVNNQVVQKNSI